MNKALICGFGLLLVVFIVVMIIIATSDDDTSSKSSGTGSDSSGTGSDSSGTGSDNSGTGSGSTPTIDDGYTMYENAYMDSKVRTGDLDEKTAAEGVTLQEMKQHCDTLPECTGFFLKNDGSSYIFRNGSKVIEGGGSTSWAKF
jgi:hypothetical protein